MRPFVALTLAAVATASSTAAAPQSLDGVLRGMARDAIGRAARDVSPRPLPVSGPNVHANSWNSTQPVRFDHVIEGPPGPVTLILEGRTVTGNQTVAVYRADPNGVRITGWRLFVIATRNGNSATATLTLPRPAAGETMSRQPVIVMVENHSGRPSQGDYVLQTAP